MDLGNPFKEVVHHLLIKGMIGLSRRDGVPMVSTLMHMVTHWTRPMVNHDIRLSGNHDFTKLL